MQLTTRTAKQAERVMDEILAATRLSVLTILTSKGGPSLESALDGAESNGEAAYRIWQMGGPPHFRLMDGARDMVLALTCLQVRIPAEPQEKTA
jgi:hypothetical protein